MATLKQYKCPNCAGALTFDSKLQKMKCPYCDSEFEMESLAAYDSDLKQAEAPDRMEWQETAGAKWQSGEEQKLRVYSCNSCGGEIIADESTAATKCPYCENPVVMKGNLSGTLKPDYVIPFKLDKNAAKDAFAKHLVGKKFLPKVFKKEAHIDEIKGVYVPFWLFDADVDAHIVYDGTKVKKWRSGSYDYTETSYYTITRAGQISFAKIPVDGSKEMDDALMDSIEPFEYDGMVNFQTAYLAGYVADKYNVTEKESVDRANGRVKQSTIDSFQKTVSGYSSLTTASSSIQLRNGKAKYALLPVWILNTTWNGEKYQFAMNGQTGKFVGNLPFDKGIVARTRFLFMGIGLAVVYGIARLLWWFYFI